MAYRENWRSLVGIGALLGLGWVLIVLNFVRALQLEGSLQSQVVGTTIPLALGFVLMAGAAGIYYYELLDHALLIAGWTVLGTASVTVAVALNVLGFERMQPDFVLSLFMIVNAAGGGAVLGFLVGLYDAQQKKLRREHELEQERAQALSQRLSVINRVLRHDVRNQAQVISGFVEQLDAARTDEETIERVLSASRRLSELGKEARDMQDLLDSEELDREVIDLADLVRTAGDDVQATYPELTIEYDLPDEQLVYTSPLLEQGIEHLLVNAVEHNDSEDPRVRVSLTESGPASRPIRLDIVDNGPGIPDSEPLPDEGYVESPLDHSSGVGLWFVEWLVQDCDGRIDIERTSTDERGTLVRVQLPTPPSEGRPSLARTG